LNSLTPKEIVEELDKYIIGQKEAKKAVAIALRNRYRRKKLPPEIREEIYPKNIIMIGSTGVGKTEIARRLARMVKAPFIKVEASKFTEVGYVGRDVESIIRELLDSCVRMVKQEKMAVVEEQAKKAAEERLLDILLPQSRKQNKSYRNPLDFWLGNNEPQAPEPNPDAYKDQREILKQKLSRMELEDEIVELEVEEKTFIMEMFPGSGAEEMGINLQDVFGSFLPKKRKKRKMTVAEARGVLIAEEASRLVDMDAVAQEAIKRVEDDGIVFLDEIDKIAGKESMSGPDVSRGGVQRDILPIVEGSTVITKYGPVKTDHILFIAAGAFHTSKPSDLIPELQGRFPIRVELESLNQEALKRILTEPHNSLIKQYKALLSTENVELSFTEEAIDYIAEIACRVNERTENIGARRLHTVMEKVLEDLLFDASYMQGQTICIDKQYVADHLAAIVDNEDLSRYIL